MPKQIRFPNLGTSAVAVIAIAALFFAVDGPAHAAKMITGKQIKNGSVTGKDIKDQSLTGQDVTDDSIAGADVAELSLAKVPSAATADLANGVAPNSITGASVKDRSLTAADAALVNGAISLDFPSIPANACDYQLIDVDVDVSNAATVVSADDTSAYALGSLSIHAARSNLEDNIRVVVCNVGAAAVNPGPAVFSYAAFR